MQIKFDNVAHTQRSFVVAVEIVVPFLMCINHFFDLEQ